MVMLTVEVVLMTVDSDDSDDGGMVEVMMMLMLMRTKLMACISSLPTSWTFCFFRDISVKIGHY